MSTEPNNESSHGTQIKFGVVRDANFASAQQFDNSNLHLLVAQSELVHLVATSYYTVYHIN